MARKKTEAVPAVPTTRRPRQRMYAGARISRLEADWVTAATSADAEIATSLVRLRDRARQLVRDNDYARAALRSIVNNVVGTGIKLQAQVPMQRGRGRLDQALNDRIEIAWRRWGRRETCHTAGQLNFPDIERLVIRSCAEAGEVFVRMVAQPFGGGRVPLALEVLEADLLDETVDGGRATAPGQMELPGGEWRLGIHVDEWGRPREYAFLRRHPGDGHRGGPDRRHILVPAEQILHIKVVERPGQNRGVTWFASAIRQLHQLAGYSEAEVVRARASSSLMGFVITDGDAAGEAMGEEQADGDYVTQFEPGVWKTLFPGQRVEVPSLDSTPTQFEAFTRTILRSVAAGLACSYEACSKDFSQTNYSSSRLSLLEEREQWKALQQQLIRDLHQPVFAAWLRAAVDAGELSLPGYDAAPERYEEAMHWVPRGWEFVDPSKEVLAYENAVRDGFMTRAEVVMSRGGDWNEVIQGLAAEKAQLDELGLVLDTDPSVATEAGISQQVATGNAKPAQKLRPATVEGSTTAEDSGSKPGTGGQTASAV